MNDEKFFTVTEDGLRRAIESAQHKPNEVQNQIHDKLDEIFAQIYATSKNRGKDSEPLQ